MAEVVNLWQGADKTIVVSHDDGNIADADEIEIVIDSCPQIRKTLTGGGIFGASSTSFSIQIEDTDTATVRSGEFNWEARYTSAAGKKTQGRLSPSRVRIIDSAFEPAP